VKGAYVSTLIYEDSVWAEHCLVAVNNFDTRETPDWDHGDGSVAACSQSIYVVVRPDWYGDVTVQVRVGEVDLPGVRTVFEGVLSVTSGIISILSPVAGDEESVVLPRAGDWFVRIAVQGEPYTDFLAVFLDSGQWRDALEGRSGA
jgi:hypothetical protein